MKMKKYLKKIAVISTAAAFFTTTASAIDDGPRMYWNLPQDLNIIQTYAWSGNGNAVSPSGAQFVEDANVDINILLFGYNRVLDIAGHTTILTVVLPTGNANATLPITYDIGNETVDSTFNQASRGIGDMYIQGTFNIFGGEAVSMEEYMTTYQQTTLLSVLIGLSIPTGEYHGEDVVNMGLNRWAGRIGLPFVQTLGDWKPGSITTLEILPSAWIYSDNDDYGSGKREQDPLYTIEAHLTQDLTPQAFVSLDYLYQTGGKTTDYLAGGLKVEGKDQNANMVGLSVGYMLNQSLQFVFRYAGTVNQKSDELDLGLTEFNFNYLF